MPNECISANLACKLVAMEPSLELSEKKDIQLNTYNLVKKIVKFGLEDPKIIGVKLKKISASKT